MKTAITLVLFAAAILGLGYKNHQLEERIHQEGLARFALEDKLAKKIEVVRLEGHGALSDYAEDVKDRLAPLEDQSAALATVLRQAAEEDALKLIGSGKIWTPVTENVVRNDAGVEVVTRTSLLGSHVYAGALANKGKTRVSFTLRDDQPDAPARVTDIVHVEYE